MLHGIPRLYQPPIDFANPFTIRLRCVDKHAMQLILMHQFGIGLSNFVMNSNVPFIYHVVTYGDEWTCTLYILY
ncbi:unnamed protein product [Calypogeia fissa]